MTEARTIVFLHGLGGSARAFDGVAALLPVGTRVMALDLPGHGDNPVREGLAVAATADLVIDRIAGEIDEPYLLVAHSMGGKVASTVAARTVSGAARPPSGLVLLAPSPPTAEPMDEDRRERMLSWVSGGTGIDERAAAEFVRENAGGPLAPGDERRAVADVRRTSPAAWRTWLERDSRADVSDEVGAVDLPAVILAGTSDDDLGASAQPGLHGSVYPRAEYVDLAGAGHLLTYEQPRDVAEAIIALAQSPG